MLVRGGGAPGPLVNLNAEIYYPPYLFDTTGARAARPSIVSAPDTVMPGDRFQVGYSGAGSVSRVSFIKTGSTTHSYNMDQRFLQLPFTANGNAARRAAAVARRRCAAGLLHAVRAQRAGRAVGRAHGARRHHHHRAAGASDFTPAAGGTGGGPFTLACEANEVLVGVRGSTATYVQQVGPLCVRVNQTGQWIGIAGGARHHRHRRHD